MLEGGEEILCLTGRQPGKCLHSPFTNPGASSRWPGRVVGSEQVLQWVKAGTMTTGETRYVGLGGVLEKGKDSQLGVPRRQVAYKPVSHQAVEEHRWTACKTPGVQVFSREGS